MSGWRRFLLTRLTGTVVVVLVLSFGIFSLVYLSPGSVEQTLLGNRPVTDATREAVRARYHLDDPFLTQYLRWLGDAVRGDFGTSIRTGADVVSMVGDRLPLTFGVTVYGGLLAVLFGFPLGIIAALRRGRLLDQAVVASSVAALSAPPFAVGLLLLVVFAVRLSWFPVYGSGNGLFDTLWHLSLPALALGLAGAGLLVRFTRTALVRELNQDYVVFARARGLSKRQVLRYAVRNSLIPVLTATGLILTSTLAATVLVEVVFALPGLGSLLVDSVTFKDVPVVQAIALLLTVLIAVVNIAVDTAYVVADPRMHSGGRR